ncbi:MAG: shikimate dehydrogenase family protein [Ilumatobacteraceae bacterium]
MPSDALLNDLRKVVTNELPERLPNTVAFIVGANPSKGARSPKLWNAAFKALGIDGEMFPLDVTLQNLAPLLRILERDSRIVGAAVAAPYKADLAQLLGERLAPAAKHCGSINLLSRNDDRDAGHVPASPLAAASAAPFFGSNTDGIAAVESLREVRPDFAHEKMLVLGCGGTGRAVIASLLNEVNPANLFVAIRSERHRAWLNSLGAQPLPTDLAGVDLASFGVVVNCTTVGWSDQANASPLDDAQIASLGHQCTVFDVVYQPDPTLLLQRAKARGLTTLSGTRMNLLQAVIAFTTANRGADTAAVAAAMKQAAS